MVFEDTIKNKLKGFKLTSRKTNLYHPNIQEKCVRYFTFTKSKTKIKLFLFPTKIMLEIKIKTPLLFTVNLPDTICLANKLLGKQVESCEIYTSRSNDNLVIDLIDLIRSDIKDLQLNTSEGLFVFGNKLELVISHQRKLIDEIISLINLKSKIEQPEMESEIDILKLPEDLHEFIPFLKEWSLSDDFEKEEKVNRTSKVKLLKLAEAVNPKMKIINNYLTNFKNEPLPYEAILIGNWHN